MKRTIVLDRWCAIGTSRPIYRVLQTTSIKDPPLSPPSSPPTSLFTVPQASAPLRPHSHDPQRRATFGTTSPQCTYGEGLAGLCVVGGRSCVVVTVVVVLRLSARTRSRPCTCAYMQRGRWTAVTTHRVSPGAESSSVRLVGTTRHAVSPPSSSFHLFFFSLVTLQHLPCYILVSFSRVFFFPPVSCFYELWRAAVFGYSLTRCARIDRSVEF